MPVCLISIQNCELLVLVCIIMVTIDVSYKQLQKFCLSGHGGPESARGRRRSAEIEDLGWDFDFYIHEHGNYLD